MYGHSVRRTDTALLSFRVLGFGILKKFKCNRPAQEFEHMKGPKDSPCVLWFDVDGDDDDEHA